MPKLLTLKTFSDSRGNLTVVEKIIPFDIKRIFYIYKVDNSLRGGHRHKSTVQAAICINGSCVVSCDNGKEKDVFTLNHPEKCLILYPEDFHEMYNFTEDAVLLVLASTEFDPTDYIYEAYDRI
ncbi:MAG: FdtA/QdtA family cupin domain-containing protein [Saprospiraceae bacterium]